MSRTFVPEEEKRAADTTDLANNIRPTANRVVQIESDTDSEPNFFYWDPSGEATNADGTTTIASNITEFADGGASEGLWRRLVLPVPAASIGDLSDVSSLSTSDGDVLAGDGSGGITSQTISSVTSGNVSLTDLSDVSDASGQPEFSSLPKISSATTVDEDLDLATKSYVDSGSTQIDIDDGDGQGTITDIATDINNIIFGAALDVTDNDGADQTLRVDGPVVSAQDNGSTVLQGVEVINLDTGVSGTNPSGNILQVTNDVRTDSDTFSGDGSTTTFNFAHGLSGTPSSWAVEPTSDEASGISHSTADSTNITVNYDTAPSSGTDNITLNFIYSV